MFTSRSYTRFKMAGSNSNDTSTFIEEIQRYECLYNKFLKDYKHRRTRENAWETIGQTFSLTAEAVPKTFFNVLCYSSSQNITEKQITSQKSSSSIDCCHFNFDLGGKKIPSASLFYRLIRFNRVCRFFTSGSSFQATETILATGTTIWKPGFKLPEDALGKHHTD